CVDVKRIPYERASLSVRRRSYEYQHQYALALKQILDLDAIRGARLKLGVDPLGGASVGYYPHIAELYGIELTVVNPAVDPRFAFMRLDHDGRIRMDCSSPYAMAGLVELADRFAVAFANDADADRHGIVVPGVGVMNPNHYLAVAIDYLYRTRTGW